MADVKSWLIGKDSEAGRDWGQEEKGTTEDEMAGWHHWLDGRESEWTPGVGDGQGGLACCDSWDTTERLNWTEWLMMFYVSSWAISILLSEMHVYYLCILLSEMSVNVCCPFSNWTDTSLLLLSIESYLYILYATTLLSMWFANISSWPVAHLFTL